MLSSESIRTLLEKLKLSGIILVLIFDQFEDVFRKKDFFKTFYKFLSDVTDYKPNLIIGFSWKSDFFIQSDDPAYHIWQQAKEQAREFTITEFGEKEIDGIIRQLEGSIGELDKGIKDRIKESSQGLPWLTKKLCIHIFDQIQSGLSKENLIEANLNILDLFKKDEERLVSKELKALKFIAKKAYEGNFFDETEVGDVVESDTIMSLLHKRLIIRSGANYNIYWDIYRDYLVTGIIPLIGESYLLRQPVNLCLEVLLLFQPNESLNIEIILKRHPKGISADTLYNILIELRNLGIVQKSSDNYTINNQIDISKDGFINFITAKFQNYTPYLKLKNLNKNKIAKSDVVQILKSTFKQEFQDTTWEYYANYLISWLLFSGIDVKSKLIKPVKGRGKVKSNIILGDMFEMIPRSSLKEITEQIPLLLNNEDIINKRFKRDLLLLDIIDDQNRLTDFGKELALKRELLLEQRLKDKCLSLIKMKKIKELITEKPKLSSKELIKLLPSNFFDGEKESSKIIYASKALTWVK